MWDNILRLGGVFYPCDSRLTRMRDIWMQCATIMGLRVNQFLTLLWTALSNKVCLPEGHSALFVPFGHV